MASPSLQSSSSRAPSSLEELRRRARAPEAEREDIDALVVALRRPVWPGQDVRGRAEVLNRILEDPFLGGLLGDGGIRVDGAAARALVALGKPHASTLSAKAREALECGLAEGAPSTPDEDEAALSGVSEASEGPREVEAEASQTAKRPLWLVLAALCLMASSPIEVSLEAKAWGGGELAFVFAVFFILVTLIAPASLVTNLRPRFGRLNYLGGALFAAPPL